MAVAPSPDASIAVRLKARDRGAFAQVYADLSDDLFAYAFSRTHDAHEAGELVQQAFENVFKLLERDELDVDRPLKPYLIRTIHNLHLKRVERGRRTQPVAEVPEPDIPPRIEGDPDRWALLQEQRKAVAHALSTLSESEREVLELAELMNLRSAEIGEILGLEPNAVDQRLFRARQKLRLEFRLTQVGRPLSTECEALLPSLSAYLDGRLRSESLARVEEHLDGCADCSAALEDMREAGRRYRALIPPVLALPDLKGGVQHVLEASAFWEAPRQGTVAAAKAALAKGGTTAKVLAVGAVVAAAAALVIAIRGGDAPADTWKRLAPGLAGSVEPGLARGADGVLHVTWSQSGAGGDSLQHQAIAPDGDVLGSPNPIVTGWRSITTSSDLVSGPDGRLQAFFAGRSQTVSLFGLATSSSDSGGRTWSGPRRASAETTWAYVASPGAGLTADGTPVVAWTTISHTPLYRFVGASPASPDVQFAPGCCVRGLKVVTDAVTGETFVGWHWLPLGEGEPGYYVRKVSATRPVGPARRVPEARYSDRRTAMTARLGAPGIFLAYATADGNAIKLWRYGRATEQIVARGTDLRSVGVAAAPEGRLWVFWESGGRYYATRSDRDASAFGPVIAVTPTPVGLRRATYGLYGEASKGPLDLLAQVQTSSGGSATWHKRVNGD